MSFKTSTIDELCNIEYGTRVVRKKDKGTIYPVYGGGGETFFIDKTNRENRVVISRFAMSKKCTRFVKGKFFLNDSGLTLSSKTKNLSQEFLDKIVLSLNYTIYQIGRGAAQRNLDMTKFKLLKITYPTSIIEQQRIVTKLDSIFEDIDKALNINLELIKSSKEVQKKFLKKLLKKQNKIKKVRLEDICTIKGRIGYRGYTKKDITTKGKGAISLSPSNIENDKLLFSKTTYISWDKYNESPEIMIYPEDIVFCKTGSTYGKIAYIEKLPEKATLNPQLIVLKNIRCDNKFLFYSMLDDNFKFQIEKIVGGAALPTLSQKDLSQTEIFLPNEDVQKSIVDILDKVNQYSNKLIEIISLKFEKFKDLKEKILNKEMSQN